MKSPIVLPTILFSSFVLILSFVPSLGDIFSFWPYRSPEDHTSVTHKVAARLQDLETIQHSSQPAARSSPPWTHDPVCTPHLDALDSPLCIYTVSTFNNNTGISIFTTPSIASSLADLPTIANPDPHTQSISKPPTPPYRLAPIPNKGHGLLATRPIPRLTPILTTHPVLLARTETLLSTRDREFYLRLALSHLPSSTQKSYYDLVRLYNIADFAAQDVVRANSFEIGLSSPLPPPSSSSSPHNSSSTATATTTPANANDLSSDKYTVINEDGSSTIMHLAIFPRAARLNHACAPNAMYHLDPDTLTHVVHATREINSGEEITVSYVGVMQGVRSRRRMLREGFGFECMCSRCVREEGEEEEEEGRGMDQRGGKEGGDGGGGDERVERSGWLGRMRSYEAWLKLWVMGEVPVGWEEVVIREKQVEEMARTYLGMFAEEGLEGFMDEAYKLASVAEWRLGRKGKAREYGKLTSEVMAMRYGPKHADVGRWRDLGRVTIEEYIQGLRG